MVSLRGLSAARIGAGYNYANIDVQIQFGEIIQREFDHEYKFRGPVVYGVLSF